MTGIYYIEDDKNISAIVKEYLGTRGYAVTVFEEIAGAKDALERHVPDVILVDWNMPDGEGDIFCQWVRRRWRELPVIFLTVTAKEKKALPNFIYAVWHEGGTCRERIKGTEKVPANIYDIAFAFFSRIFIYACVHDSFRYQYKIYLF